MADPSSQDVDEFVWVRPSPVPFSDSVASFLLFSFDLISFMACRSRRRRWASRWRISPRCSISCGGGTVPSARRGSRRWVFEMQIEVLEQNHGYGLATWFLIPSCFVYTENYGQINSFSVDSGASSLRDYADHLFLHKQAKNNSLFL